MNFELNKNKVVTILAEEYGARMRACPTTPRRLVNSKREILMN